MIKQLKFIGIMAVMSIASIFVTSCGTMPVPKTPTAQPSPVSTQASVAATADDLPQQTKTDNGNIATATGAQNEQQLASPDDSQSPSDTVQQTSATTVAIAPPPSSTVTTYPVLSSRQRVQNAITFLNIGQESKAKSELNEALALEPNNRLARNLMQQINQTGEEYFNETESFEYVLRPNETLSTVAEKFLKDPLKFHALAKYNDVTNPTGLMPGKIIKIPGSKPDLPELTAQQQQSSPQPVDEKDQSSREEQLSLELAKRYYDNGKYQTAIDVLDQHTHSKSTNPKVRDLLVLSYTKYAGVLAEKADLLEAQTVLEKAVSVQPENRALKKQLKEIKSRREADRLYQIGLEEYNAGNESEAYDIFTKVVALDADHKLARKQIVSIKSEVIESYHKQAMTLYRKQELREAISKWDEVLKLDPDHELAKLYRARAQELKRKIDQL